MQRAQLVDTAKVNAGLSAAEANRVRTLALQKWRQAPLAPAEEIAASATFTVHGFRPGRKPEGLPPDQQARFFGVLSVVAAARVEFLQRKSLRELVQALRAEVAA